MFKILGAILIVVCTTFLCSQKIIRYYYTHNFLDKTIAIVKKINFERNSNMVYEKLFKKLDFNKQKFIAEMQANCYIDSNIKDKVNSFFGELGRKNKSAEDEYVDYFLSSLILDKKEYSEQYMQNKKLYVLYGFSLGLFIVIILI